MLWGGALNANSDNAVSRMLPERQILVIGLAVEAALAGVYFVWAYYRGAPFDLAPESDDVLMGLAAAVALMIFNLALLKLARTSIPLLRQCGEFVDEVVKPLADQLSVRSAAVISISAGVGEELFFRGMLQAEFGVIAASALFAAMHFGTAIAQFPVVALLYFFIGFALGLLYLVMTELWVVIIAHGLYDFIALIYLKHFYQVSEKMKPAGSGTQ